MDSSKAVATERDLVLLRGLESVTSISLVSHGRVDLTLSLSVLAPGFVEALMGHVRESENDGRRVPNSFGR